MESHEGFLNEYLAKKVGENEEFVKELIHLSRQGHLCKILSEKEKAPHFSSDGPIIQVENRYYLKKNWALETKVVEQLQRLKSLSPPSLHDETIFYEALKKTSLQPEQEEAIRVAFSRSFSLICGGPGTGKTYTASQFVHLLGLSCKDRFYVTLAAPTGKAASHLQRSLGALPDHIKVRASTLHRLLYRPGRIDADLVIVDEGSMIDVSLWGKLLESIGEATRLIILGDPDQLPPVEAGSLFSDIAPQFGLSLNRCMRTDDQFLTHLARAVREGNGDEMLKLLPLSPTLNLNELYQKIYPWISLDKPDPMSALNHYKRLGILNALRQGPSGSDAIQKQILNLMSQQVQTQWWAIPILVTANESRLELYNGTFGVMLGQGNRALSNLQGTAYFPSPEGTLIAYPSPPPIEPAFCISVHKSQGSEFEEVVAIFPSSSQRLGREAIYTAVTRAKKKLEWVGEEKTLKEMIAIRSHRVSGLICTL